MDLSGLDPALVQQVLQAAGGGGGGAPPPPPGPPPARMDDNWGRPDGGRDRDRDRRGGRGGRGGYGGDGGLERGQPFGGVCKAYTELRCGYGETCKFSHDSDKIRAAVDAGLCPHPVPEFRWGVDNPQIFARGGGRDRRDDPNRGRPLTIQDPDQQPVRNLRVENFPNHWQRQDLRGYFQQFGELDDVGILVPGKLAFVKFMELDVARQVNDSVAQLPPVDGRYRLKAYYHSNQRGREMRDRRDDFGRDRDRFGDDFGRDRRDDFGRERDFGRDRAPPAPSPMSALGGKPSQADAIAQLMKTFGGANQDATAILASLGLGGAAAPKKSSAKVFIVVRAANHNVLSESVKLGAYPTDLTAAETIAPYVDSHENVYLLFSVNGLSEFAGYAKVERICAPTDPGAPSLPPTFPHTPKIALLKWLSVGSVPFAAVGMDDPFRGSSCREFPAVDGTRVCAAIDGCYKTQQAPATVNDIDVANLQYDEYLRLVAKQVASAASRQADGPTGATI